MKEKKDCKECGAPLKDWQIKQGYDLCLECYNSKRTSRKTSHEILKEEAIEKKSQKVFDDEEDVTDKEDKEMQEVEKDTFVEGDLGEDNGHLENYVQGEEKED